MVVLKLLAGRLKIWLVVVPLGLDRINQDVPSRLKIAERSFAKGSKHMDGFSALTRNDQRNLAGLANTP